MLLVHGITTWSFLWDGLLDLLTARHEVIAVDLLGCGRSDKPLDVSYSIKDHARRLGLLVEALGLGPVHYGGHDLGGGVGQILAARRPELLRTLTLVNTVGYDFWPVQPVIALRTPILRQLLLATFDVGTLRLVVRRGLVHPEKLTPALLARFQEPFRQEAGRRSFLHFARCLDNGDLMEIAGDLERLALPVTVVWGEGDLYLSPAIAERLVASIPGARLERLPTAGHFSPIDEPEQLAALLLRAAGRAR
jgi:pimeloyl-ACP methyl ester carboxylesterase